MILEKMVPASAVLQQSAMEARTCSINCSVDIKKLDTLKKQLMMYKYKGIKELSKYQRT